MTVKELISELKKQNQDAKVRIHWTSWQSNNEGTSWDEDHEGGVESIELSMHKKKPTVVIKPNSWD